MADKLFPIGDGSAMQRYKDMGDGTHAKVVYIAGVSKFVRPNSVLWLGDSLTAQGGQDLNPVIPPFVKTFNPSFSLPNVSPNGNIRGIFVSETCAVGVGTIRYYASSKSISWQAFGDTEGAAVPVGTGGYFAIPSGTPGSEIYISWLGRLIGPASNVSNTITIPSGATCTRVRASIDGFPGAWQAYRGFPFKKSINFGISGASTVDYLMYKSQWETIRTDITIIEGGTNDDSTKAGKDAALANIKTIVSLRRGLGSIPIVVLPFLGSYLNPAQYQIAMYYNNALKEYCISEGVLFADAAPYLTNPYSSNGGQRAGAFRSDNLHLSGSGSFMAAKYALDPVISPLLSVSEPAVSTALYDAANFIFGNMLTIPGLTGAVSAVSAGDGVTGTRPTGSSHYRAGGTASLVSKAPQDASPVLRADGKPGAWWRNAITNPVGAADSYFIGLGGAINAANYVVGDKVVFSGEIRFSGANIDFVHIYLNSTKGAVYALSVDTSATNVGDLFGETLTVRFETEPLLVTAGMANITPLIYAGVGSGGSITLDIAPTLSVHKSP